MLCYCYRPIILFLVLSFIVMQSSCNKKKSQQSKVLVSKNEPEKKAEPVKIKPKIDPVLESNYIPVDLTPYGIRGQISLPPGTRIQKNSPAHYDLQNGKEFSLEILLIQNKSIEGEKKQITALPKTKIIEEQPTHLVWETEVSNQYLQNILAEVSLGNRKYWLRSRVVPGVRPAILEKFKECIHSLQQTNEMVQLDKESPSHWQMLEKSGCKLQQTTKETVLILGRQVQQNDLSHLKFLLNIDAVQLENANGLNDHTIPQLFTIPGLRKLILDGKSFGDGWLSKLVGFKQLKGLVLNKTSVTTNGLKQIANAIQIEELHLDHLEIPEELIAGWMNFSELRVLSLEQTNISDPAMESLSQCGKLQILNLAATRITDRGLQRLGNLRNLRELNISDCNLSGTGLTYFRETPLEKLYANNTLLIDTAIVQLKKLPLRILELDQSNLHDISLKTLAEIPTLEKLSLANTALTDTNIPLLNSLQELRELNLAGTAIQGNGFASLTQLKFLTDLDLQNTDFRESALPALANFPNLHHLNLNDLKLTDSAVEALKKCHAKTVSLKNTQLTQKGFAQLSKLVPGVQWLGNAISSGIAVTDVPPPIPLAKLSPADPIGLCKRLKREPVYDPDDANHPIIELDFSNSMLTDKDLAELRDLSQLRVLKLNDNPQISDAGLAYLVRLTNLKFLDLRFTGIHGDGLHYLANCTKLQKLYFPPRKYSLEQLIFLKNLTQIEDCPKPPEVAWTIWIQLVRSWVNTARLNLSGPEIANQMLSGLDRLTVLKEIQVSGRISELGLSQLGKHKDLEILTLDLPSISQGGITVISELSKLRILQFGQTRISNEMIPLLRSISGLDKIAFDGRWLLDSGIAAFKESSLTEIVLPHAAITDKGVKDLSEMKNLEWLDLRNAPHISDAALKDIAKLEELRYLNLSSTAITGMNFSSLAKLPKLGEFILAGTKINDVAIKELTAFENLQVLDLRKTAITDQSIPILMEMPHLKRIGLENTKITKDGMNRLKMSRPALEWITGE